MTSLFPWAHLRCVARLRHGLAALWLVGWPGVQAQTMAAAPTNELGAISAQVEQMARDSAGRAGLPDARVQVEVGSLDPRLQLAPCQRIEPYLPPGLPAWGRTRIGLRCTQGSKLWNVSLPVTVHVWARSLVTVAALPAGTVLTPDQLIENEVDMAAAPGVAISRHGAAVGRTLSRPLPAGSALRATDLKARQWFAAGETVRVVAVGPGWQVVTEGQAMSPGLEGQIVRVRTETGRLLQARPVGDRQVEVAL
jgi:flagellar basal body P-ring formation protein FlgA